MRSRGIDAALLDLELGSEQSHPIADALSARQVPFAFISGHGHHAVEGSRHADAPVLAERFGQPALAAMRAQLASSR